MPSKKKRVNKKSSKSRSTGKSRSKRYSGGALKSSRSSRVKSKNVSLSYRTDSLKLVRSTGRKLILAFKNFLWFAVLSIIMYILYLITNHPGLNQVFYIFYIISAFVSIAFLLVWFVLLLLRAVKK